MTSLGAQHFDAAATTASGDTSEKERTKREESGEDDNDGDDERRSLPAVIAPLPDDGTTAPDCLHCKKAPQCFASPVCGHHLYCRKCAMRVASGGRCRVCSKFFPSLAPIPNAPKQQNQPSNLPSASSGNGGTTAHGSSSCLSDHAHHDQHQQHHVSFVVSSSPTETAEDDDNDDSDERRIREEKGKGESTHQQKEHQNAPSSEFVLTVSNYEEELKQKQEAAREERRLRLLAELEAERKQKAEADQAVMDSDPTLCLKCHTEKKEFEASSCGHHLFCKKCAMKCASGGKCKICGVMYADLRKIFGQPGKGGKDDDDDDDDD